MKTMIRNLIAVSLVLLTFSSFGLYRLNELNKKPIHPDNFSTYNLVEIYVLGIVMSALAYPIYPEIAIEHMSLYFKEKKDSHSCFFLESSVVNEAIENYEKPVMLLWDSRSYMIGHPEARFSLALNGATLSIQENIINVAVPIRYPRYALARVLPMVEVQEGLFWVLQQRNWYHTGVINWVCDKDI